MKRNFFMMAFVSLFTVVALCSCSKDENEDDDTGGNGVIQNNTINVIIENGAKYSSKIDSVKAGIDYRDSDRNHYYVTLASAPYNNIGFTLKLPESVSGQYLYSLAYVWDYEEIEGLTASNHSVKLGELELYAYKSNSNSATGYFYYGTEDSELVGYGWLTYADGDVSITGSYTENESNVYYDGTYYDELKIIVKYNNYHLKKGWNMDYERETKKTDNSIEYELTTQAPAGAKWYFDDYSSYSTSGSLRKQVSPLSAKHKHRFLSESGFSGLED
jgi:hypothetical protein